MGKLAVFKFAYFLSIIFTLLILGLSVFAYYAGKINPAENMFAAYIALGKPVLVIINAVLLVYWLIRFRYWLWLPLVALAVNYEYITSMYQLYTPTKFAYDSKLKVVTYNVHSFGGEITGFSAKEFAGILKKGDVDVACFQEYGGNGDFTDKDLYDTYSKLFPYSFFSKGQAIYSRYPIKQSQVIEFPNTNNGASWVDIEVKGRTIRVINVHMQTTSIDRMRSKMAKAKVDRDELREEEIYSQFLDNILGNMIERGKQAKEISALVNATEHPVILCGDFNDTPGTFTYETLKHDLKDGFITSGVGYAGTYRGFYNLMRIDYLFHSASLEGIKYEVKPFDMSDHNPVFLEVGL